ncbi:hypothetical protein [Segatella copri]|jgi:hypothetical protein|uniref:hypothetical protein n=1 Tax=Segatella copri TaxID=165179 RepID=UPI002FEED34F
MENNNRTNFELFATLCSSEPEEEIRERFKEIIADARDLEIEIPLGAVERIMEVCRQIKDLAELDNEPVSNVAYSYELEDEGKFCHDDLQIEPPSPVDTPSPVDISGHMHLLVDVAMQERDYHNVLVVRNFLETFNRIDNHLVEAELPRLDAYIATLDGYYEYLEQRNRKPLKNGTRIGRKKEYLFVSDEASSLKDEETTAEQASLFIEFLTLNGLDSMSTSASKSSPMNIAIFAFIRYWRRRGILAPQHIVSANAIYRFLTEDCNIRKEVTIKSFNNVFNHCEDIKNQEMDDKVAEFFAHR